MRGVFLSVITGLAVIAAGCSVMSPDEEKSAFTAVNSWLAALDKGEYAKCYDLMAPQAKEAKSKEQFVSETQKTRAAAGKLTGRKPISRKLETQFPDGSYGKGMIFKNELTRQDRGRMVETVTAAVGSDGQWRVMSYSMESF
jgi:hypothetical protein